MNLSVGSTQYIAIYKSLLVFVVCNAPSIFVVVVKLDNNTCLTNASLAFEVEPKHRVGW